MTIIPEITWGQILAIAVPLIVGVVGIYVAYVIFRTKTEGAVDTVQEGLVDTNKRLSELAVGVSELKSEVHAFKDHVQRHYVEKDEIAELRQSFDRSIDRMQQSLDAAVGTMGDVRDAVLVLTAKGAKATVPSQRRPARAVKAAS